MSADTDRVRRFAYLGLAASGAAAVALLALTPEPRLMGVETGLLAPLGLLVAGLGAAAFGIARARPAALAAGALLALLAVLPAGAVRPGIAQYALGLAFGAGLLAAAEMLHITERQERAARAAHGDAAPATGRVTGESLRTFAARAGLALAVAAAAVGLAQLLSVAGPAQWRAALETGAPLGVAVVGLALLGAASLFVLVRGARFTIPAALRGKTTKENPADDVAEQ